MNRRKRILGELEDVNSRTPVGDQGHLEMKKIQSLQVESLIELIETLDKMDETNKKMDESNKELTRSNIDLTKSTLELSKRNLWLQVFIASVSVIALLVALFMR